MPSAASSESSTRGLVARNTAAGFEWAYLRFFGCGCPHAGSSATPTHRNLERPASSPPKPTLQRGTSHTSSMLQNKPLPQSSRRSHAPPSTQLHDSGQAPKASGNRQQRQHP